MAALRFRAELMPRLMLIANSAWNLAHFRGGLIRALAAKGYELVAVCPQADLMPSDYRSLPVEHQTMRLDRSGLNPIADLQVVRDLSRLIDRSRPDAILSFTIKPNIYGCIAAARAGIPAIPNVSGLGTAFKSSRALRLLVERLYRFAFRNAPAVFFQNRDDLVLFVERGLVRRSQAMLVPGSGIDIEHFSPRPLPAGEIRFLLIGRLLRDKGVREYAGAAKSLRPQFPAARFQLLGPLDPLNRTAIAADELGAWVADGTVEYLGTTDDVRPVIDQASVIVLPSYHEGMPRTLLEGAAMARPLVASDIPGCREIVREGLTGLLCKAGDAGSLARAMAEMAAMPHERRVAMGLAARSIAKAEFDQQIVINAYVALLERLIRRRESCAPREVQGR